MATPTPTPKSQSSLKHLSHTTQPSSQVRVVLRVRPFLPAEIETQTPIPCITVLDPDYHTDQEVTVHLKDQYTSRNECYKLDSFFGQGDFVGEIFEREVGTVIPGIFQGRNATVFAYGATGSGKTYTMQGMEGEPGLIPLAMSEIFSLCESASCSVEIAYYEVYMDRCYDLLEPKEKEIRTLDDHEGNLQLMGLSLVAVHSMDEFSEAFSTAIRRRKVAETGLNDVSSRSHGVLSIVVNNCGIKGKLNLIDLAGNEDNRRTCNEGIRLQESAKINQSLFALSNVIYALNNNEPRIPYRESKLTRILQDSLGGPSRALMIACLNPASYQEAVHTVSLAARSRHIVNYVGSANKAPKEKIDMEAKLKAWLESKSKTKSTQRLNGPYSPAFGRTPTSVSSSKNLRLVQSSVKAKTTMGRKLFDSGLEDAILSSTNTRHVLSQLTEETDSCGFGGNIGKQDSIMYDSPFIVKDDHYQDRHVLHEIDQLQSSESVDSFGFDPLKEQDDRFLNRNITLWKDQHSEKDMSSLIRNNHLETPKEDVPLHRVNANEDIIASDFNLLKLAELPESMSSPTLRRNIKTEQNSLRKASRVLSPISSNVTPTKHISSDHPVLELKTPITPNVVNCGKDEDGMLKAPIEKFNASSSNLKESLVQEYITFLNVATKEELLQLKGIGQKRAEYIVELREDSPNPIKSLSDLEKIGLSSRQVHDMFRKMARGIFA